MSTLQTTTSTTRPSAQAGDTYFETDTKNIIVYDGTNWRGYANDGASGWSGTNAYSLGLDGTDDRVEIDSVVTSSATAGTVSAWVKTSQTSGSQFIFTQTDKTASLNNVYVSFSLSNQIARLQWRNGGTPNELVGNQTLAANQWNHIMWVSTGTAYKIYTNGTLNTLTVNAGSDNGNWFGDATGLDTNTIGCQDRYTGRVAFFTGNIDELAVWDSDQSSNLSTIYGSSTPGSGSPGNIMSTAPSHWWRMGDGIEANSGSTVYDMSANFVNGTLIADADFEADVKS
jgi:hypothetical protein